LLPDSSHPNFGLIGDHGYRRVVSRWHSFWNRCPQRVLPSWTRSRACATNNQEQTRLCTLKCPFTRKPNGRAFCFRMLFSYCLS
jgi:hypothetical protein